jgi:hypothetical protein
MSLTVRQRAMLEQLIELYREAREPIHYTVAAQRLGVRNTTAYEMLKLLEREGYVTSQYILPGSAGPGRSSVVFAPTSRAHATFRHLAGSVDSDADWQAAKRQILSKLGQGEGIEQSLLQELLARLSDAEPPLVFCAKTLTALLLNLDREARHRLPQYELIRRVFASEPSARNILSLLPGFVLGLAWFEPARRFSERLIQSSEACQVRLQDLDDAKRSVLLDFMRQVLDSMRDLAELEGPDSSVSFQPAEES